MSSSSFLECRRCSSFLLKSTSTAKRVHNVKCLGNLIKSQTRPGRSFQSLSSSSQLGLQFEPKSFQNAFIKLTKFNEEDIPSLLKESQLPSKKKLTNQRIDVPIKKQRKMRNAPDPNLIIQSSRVRKSSLKACENESILANGNKESEDEDEENEDYVDQDQDSEEDKEEVPRKRRGRKPKNKSDDEHGTKKMKGSSEKPAIRRKRVTISDRELLKHCWICDGYVKTEFLTNHKAHFHPALEESDHKNGSCECDLKNCESRPWKECYREPSNQPLSAECLICGSFVSRFNIQRHISDRHRDKAALSNLKLKNPLPCGLCSARFKKFHSLKKHFVHSHMTNSPFVCKFLNCSARFGDYFTFETHVMKHVEESKVECEDCGQFFKTMSKLGDHQRNGRCITSTIWQIHKRRLPVKYAPKHNMVSVWRIKAKMEENNEGITMNNFNQLQSTSVKTVELERINLVNPILKKEHEAVHVKGEAETAIVVEEVVSKYPEVEMKPNLSGKEKRNNLLEEMLWDVEAVEDSSLSKAKNKEEEEELTMSEVRIIVSQFLLSCNSKIRSAVYLNSLIRDDPVFQKLEKEDPKCAQGIVRPQKTDTDYFTSTFQPYGIGKLFQCENCGQGFCRFYALEKHRRSKSSLCRASTPSRIKENEGEASRAENDHGDSTTSANSKKSGTPETGSDSNNGLKLTCADCGFLAHTASMMRKHAKTCSIHNKAYFDKYKVKCPVTGCGTLFQTRDRLETHMEELHNAEKKFKCDKCDKAFTKSSFLRKHNDSVHHRKYFKFHCNLCKRRFNVQDVWKKHVLLCAKGRPTCQQCGERFTNPAGLKRHVLFVHAHGTALKLASGANSGSNKNKNSSDKVATDEDTSSNQTTDNGNPGTVNVSAGAEKDHQDSILGF